MFLELWNLHTHVFTRFLAGKKKLMENGQNKSARRYEVSSMKTNHESIVRFQSVSMSATSGNNNHVATQNNVMMNSVAVDTSQNYTA